MINMNIKSKKMAVTILTAILLIILYIIIFCFSAQDGETSGGISREISQKCVEIVDGISNKHWSVEIKKNLAIFFEHPIRKLAHFSEYACMGALLYAMLIQWMKKGKIFYASIVGWVFVSAAFDEIHQLFSPGRMCSFFDVCLDTSGAITALVFLCVLDHIFMKKSKRECK